MPITAHQRFCALNTIFRNPAITLAAVNQLVPPSAHFRNECRKLQKHAVITELCCANPVRDSSCEPSVVAELHEQTHTPPTYKTKNWPSYIEALKRRGSLTIRFDHAMTWEAAPIGNTAWLFYRRFRVISLYSDRKTASAVDLRWRKAVAAVGS